MDCTGGSYMQQPLTNSEGVRRCMNIPHAPPSGQMMRMEPRPPYGVDRDAKRRRPYSAPARRVVPAYKFPDPMNPARPYSVALSHRHMESDVSHAAPFAARQLDPVFHTPSVYSRSPSGGNVPLASYTALNDPHLNEYFERKFAYLNRYAIVPSRPRSHLGHHGRYGISGVSPRGGSGKGGNVLYKIAVTTGDKKNAGTDAKVYIKLKGSKGKIPKTRLTKKAGSVKSHKSVAFRFAKGSTHVFKIHGPDIGDIRSVVIEHNGARKEDAWFLQEIEIVKKKKTWLFVCNQWLSLFHGDGHASRELFPQHSAKTEYEVVVVTGDLPSAGTSANVSMTLYGKTGATNKIHLKNSSKTLFDRGSSDVFRISSNCVGPMKKLRIEHDNTGLGPGWFLDRIVVSDLRHRQWKYFFPCGQWLARDEGDGAICRDLIGSRDPLAIRKGTKYKVTVYTGNVKGAGTDANVFITIFGENGDSGERQLTSSKNNFERGKQDEFVLESPMLGRLKRVRICHDNSGFGPGWFLEKVIVDDLAMGTVYTFPCARWLADDEDDGQIARDLLEGVGPMDAAPGFPYVVTVRTGDKLQAGTDARVYVVLYGGKDGQNTSGKIWLNGGSFERNSHDVFTVDVANMLSPMAKIDVGHDNSGAASGWYLADVTIYCPASGLEQLFPCNKWLATTEGDGRIERTLFEQKSFRKKKEKKDTWYIWVRTSDVKGAGTDANVHIMVYGDKGKSDDVPLDNKGDNFEKGKTDNFKVSMTDVGKPYKLRVWHDDSGAASGWHLDSIEMENMSSKERYTFHCDRWLARDEDDGEIIREIPAEGKGIKKPLPLVKYEVEVTTGNVRYAGTDANVYIDIFGELGDTGPRPLRKSNNVNKFERKSVDTFVLEAVTLKKLKKIRIGHDGKNPGSGWFLDKVLVKEVGNPKYDTSFECHRWLDINEDDGLIEREITAGGSQMLSTTSYHVSVKTGDVRGAGTDANVFLKIFGVKGDTGRLQLRASDSATNKFERGRVDLFKLEATDIGKLKRIQIGHDSSKPGSGWFLDEVKIDIPSRGEHYRFACHRWLDKSEGDGLTEVELEPAAVEARDKNIPYEVTVWTGDMQGAGTDANVFLQMYGEDGKTEEIILTNRTDNFERGDVEKFKKFKVEAPDVGRLRKVRIGHDGAGLFSGWYLEKMLIQRRPRKGTKKRRRGRTRPLSAGQQRRQSLYHVRSDSEESDRSPSPATRPRSLSRQLSRSQQLKTVEEEEEEYNGDETEDYWFFVSRWFSRNEDDKAIVRELIPTDEHGKPLDSALEEVEYTVKVQTGDKFGAGTDANIFINIYGENGDTGERHLKDSENINKFERNQTDSFSVKAIDLGKLQKVKIRHDNKGGGAAWHLDHIEVEDRKRKKSYLFPCQRWLATDKDDGQISRELVPVDSALKRRLSRMDSKTSVRDEILLETHAAKTVYHVKVYTGKDWGAGTDANVYVDLFGENDNTGKMFLKTSLTNKNKFERGKMDEFTLEAVNIGELKKIKIGHDNAGGGAPWQLDKVEIDSPSLGRTWIFPCNRWLAADMDDGKLERELFPQELATQEYTPCIPYEVTTYTSDMSGAGTGADVFIALYGKDVCTEKKPLCKSKQERKGCFKKGAVDKFIVELEDVGETIEKIRIGHDNSGFGSGWHLNKVEVRKLHDSGKGSITYVFPCNRWLASDEDDKATVRELLPEKAVVERVGRDGEMKSKQMDIKDKLVSKKYVVNVYTGDESGAGTDANVFLTIFGDRGDSGERALKDSETHRDKFEKNQVDKFNLEAVDLGKIYKIHIRHDNSMISPAWFLDKVEVLDIVDNQTYTFYCERWLAKNKGDGKIERTLYVKGYDGDMSSTGTLRSSRFGSVSSIDSLRSNDPFSKSPRVSRRQSMAQLEAVPEGPTIPYTIKVATGSGEDNGTKSNVWVRILGKGKKHTGRQFLELVQKDGFEPGSVECFSLEAVDVTEVKQIEVGHDGTTPGSGWFLKSMEVDMPTKGKHYHFLCQQWLACDKSDGKTTRTFSVEDGQSSVTSYKPMIPYEATVFTGDVQNAGTDSKIFLTAFGTKGTSSPVELDKMEHRFERGQQDVIKMELDDVAPLKKLRVEVKGKSGRPAWFLEKVHLRNMATGQLSVFEYNGWLGKDKDGPKSCDIPAKEGGKVQVAKTNYTVTVKTSDVRGAGTNANVYIMMFGVNGDSGEIHLKNSTTNKSPFDSGQTDVFEVKNILSLGELSKVRVWHDNKGLGSAWHLSSVEVEDQATRKRYMFYCNKWLSTSDDDKQIIRELTCATAAQPDGTPTSKAETVYEIEVTTTDKKEGGTIHNAWIIMEGSKRSSKMIFLENSAKEKILRKGQTDTFRRTCPNLGKLKKCIVGAYEREDKPITDGAGRETQWHCHEIVVTDTSTGDRYTFPCKDWIEIATRPSKQEGKVLKVKGVEESHASVVRNLAPVKYEVVVYTGDVKGSGTNANVFLTIYGSNGDTGKRPLTQKFRDLFERNQVDKFQIEALDLGELNRVRIEHDNSGFRPGWFLDRIEITNLATSMKAVFPCEQWLDASKGDKQIARELFPRAGS